MSDANKLKLDLNESLFFESGYEISEMINISLTPEISIQSFNDYMSIRGIVELAGQYIREIEMSDQTPLRDGEAYQWINKVRNKPNNQVEFSHYFPIDISVPLNRISDVNDVTVEITSFDYNLLESDHLQIYSTVHINGIQDDHPKTRNEFKDETIELDDEFSFEMLPISKESLLENTPEQSQEERQDPKTTEKKVEEKTVDKRDEKEVVAELSNNEKPVSTSPPQEENVLQLVPDQKSSLETKDREEEKREINQQRIEEDEVGEAKEAELQITEETDDKKDVDQSTEEEQDLIRVEDPHHTVEEMTQTDEEQNAVKDVSYLADMFQSDEERTFTKMRLCIVQDQDTIQSIAKKYEVEPLIIMNENNLQDDHISEGQLLYIPK